MLLEKEMLDRYPVPIIPDKKIKIYQIIKQYIKRNKPEFSKYSKNDGAITFSKPWENSNLLIDFAKGKYGSNLLSLHMGIDKPPIFFETGRLFGGGQAVFYFADEQELETVLDKAFYYFDTIFNYFIEQVSMVNL